MILVLLLIALSPSALAQLPAAGKGIEGNWLGTLEPGPVKLRLALKVAAAPDGTWAAGMNSLDQGASYLPVSSIVQTGSAVKFAMASIGGSFEGTLNVDGSEMSGVWKQGGASLPLVFRRTQNLPVMSRPQEPKKPYPYIEEEVTYENKAGAAKLAGTLTLPKGMGPFPAVLLITGSGQQDRDEALMGHRPFLVLADHLTRHGIAVLRVDDRGIGGSTGDVKAATTADFAGDALAGVQFLKSRKDIRRIGLIGHSEGGVIAPMVATRSRDVAFVVMMAGTGVPGEQVLLAQQEALSKISRQPAAGVDAQRQVMDIIKQEPDAARREAALREWKEKFAPRMSPAELQASASPWMRFFVMYDPALALSGTTCPVLALNGELDLQVLPAQNLPAIVKALEAGGNRDYEIVKLPKLNHLFQTSDTGSPMEYSKIEETIAPVALEIMSSWILRHIQ